MLHSLVDSAPLLIVPYGIETNLTWKRYRAMKILLIVPYGIETEVLPLCFFVSLPFNCTLWNWNVISYTVSSLTGAFNCTLWNWNEIDILQSSMPYPFNCTLWNWNGIPEHICQTLYHLLIVPYGIETSSRLSSSFWRSAFNCTLWNWNALFHASRIHGLSF